MMSRGSAVPQRQLFWDAAGKLEQDIIGVDAPRNLSSPSAAEEGVPLPGILEGLLSREDRHNNAYEYVGALLAIPTDGCTLRILFESSTFNP